jgi:hypothetical protein
MTGSLMTYLSVWFCWPGCSPAPSWASGKMSRSGPRRPINLIGGGLSFLVPAAGTTALAKLQGWLHIIGAIRFPAGVAIVPLKGIRSPPDGLAGNAAGTSPCHFLSSSVA